MSSSHKPPCVSLLSCVLVHSADFRSDMKYFILLSLSFLVCFAHPLRKESSSLVSAFQIIGDESNEATCRHVCQRLQFKLNLYGSCDHTLSTQQIHFWEFFFRWRSLFKVFLTIITTFIYSSVCDAAICLFFKSAFVSLLQSSFLSFFMEMFCKKGFWADESKLWWELRSARLFINVV